MQVETPIQEPIKKDLYVVETSKNRTVRVPQVYLGYFIKSKEAIDKGTQEPVVAAAKEETTPVQEPVVAAAMEETTPVQEPIVVVAMEEQIKPEESVEVEKPKEMDNVSAIGPTSNDNIKSMIEDVAKMKSERDNAVNENETLRERLLKETEKANSLNSKLSELELNNGKLSGELVSLKSELVEVNDRHSQENSLLKSKLTIMENKVNDLTDAASRVDEYKNRAEQAEHKLIYVLDNLQGVINNDSKQKAA